MFPAYPGPFMEINPQAYPVTSIVAAKSGIVGIPMQEYGYSFHADPNQGASTLSLNTDNATVNYGSTGKTTGSNIVNVWFEGASETWARKGAPQLGGTVYWRQDGGAAVQTSEMSRGIEDALKRIKGQMEYIGREGVYNNPSVGTTGTFQQRGYRYAPGITNQAAGGAVAGAGTLGTFGTLNFTILVNTLQRLWDNKILSETGGNLTMFCASTPKKLVSEIFKTEYSFGANASSTKEAGVNLQRFETDFGLVDIVLCPQPWDQDTIYVLNTNVMRLVARPVPGKGFLFEEELGKTRASDQVGIYGEGGIDHGHGSAHARIYGIGSTIIGGQAVSAT